MSGLPVTQELSEILRSLMTFLRRAWLPISTAMLIFSVPLRALPCEYLRSLPIQGATVTWVQPVAADSFQPSGSDLAPFRHLPAFCRVAATLRPTSDSEIRVEIWLPEPLV